MITAITILIASAVTGPAVSALVPPDHEHDWAQVLDDPEGEAWVDDSHRGSVMVEGAERPEILIRMDFKLDDMTGLVDLTLAVDCEGKRLGISSAWGDPTGQGQSRQFRPADVEVAWDFSDTPPHANDLTIINHACALEDVAQ